MSVRIITGDALEQLRLLSDESVHCCVTSPPYYGLRDYQVAGQIGLESSPAEYIEKLATVFREVRRVLRIDGTCWVNMGDSYASSGRATYRSRASNNKGQHVQNDMPRPVDPHGIKPKDLLGIPWMLAFALQADGWWLRQDIIWSKPNPMPESVNDRCTKAHEYLFLLAKAATYFYDARAIAEPANTAGQSIKMTDGWDTGDGAHGTIHRTGREKGRSDNGIQAATRNKRSVWTIATAPCPEAHFATFPPGLVEPCILAGTSARGVCARCGAPWARVVEHSKESSERPARGKALTSPRQDGNPWNENSGRGFMPVKTEERGWQPSCVCGAAIVPATTLDPFIGSGTTAIVADRLGRNCIGIELNEDNARMGCRRIAADAGMFTYLVRE